MPEIKHAYTIDLRLPADERLARLIKAEKQNTKCLVGNAIQQMREQAGDLTLWLAKKIVPAIYKMRKGAFRDELDVWTESGGIDFEELVLANLSYELSQLGASLPRIGTWFGCTALAFNRKGDNGVAHVRNMDWPLDGCGRLSALLHYKGACGDFTSIGWPCFSGVISSIARGRFSITLNQAPQVGLPNANWPAAFALRIIFEECETFDQAVSRLKRFDLAASGLFLVVGTKRDQAVVIEHTGRKAHCRWMKDGVLALANHYEIPKLKKYNPKIQDVEAGEEDPQANSEARAAFAFESARKGAGVPIKKMLSLLNKKPVLFEKTAQRMALVPKTGEYVAHYWA
jgi:hypothetical protein